MGHVEIANHGIRKRYGHAGVRASGYGVDVEQSVQAVEPGEIHSFRSRQNGLRIVVGVGYRQADTTLCKGASVLVRNTVPDCGCKRLLRESPLGRFVIV